ncbi:MAG TPA: MoxR family ATPase [Thermoanaerobaculia bacterium]|nr:MoxR family ATPase [Thermoanaerobaculia bacterium]
MSELTPQQFRDTAGAIEAEVGKVIVGQAGVVRHVLICVIAGGHALLEGVPGLGKTMLIKTLADALELQFARIQFTPDLMPADIVGTEMLEESPEGRRSFRFQAGPIFANFVLADEINRATPKTQSALLEAMNEGAVTVESERRALPQPFMVVATQNPVEYLGTYPLPESQMDRFLLRLTLGYPSAEEEKMLLRRGGTERVLAAIPAVLGPAQVLALQDETEKVAVSERLLDYLHALVRATRENTELRLPVSTRGAQALFRAVQAYAFLHGRAYATPDDAQVVAEPVLAHRILSISSDGFGAGGREREIVRKILTQVPVPV